MVIITSMHYESTVIHNAGVSESNFLEKFAHVVADPAIMEVLKSMMLGSVTPAHHEEQYSHNHRVGDLSHEWCRPLFYKQSGSTSIIMSTTLLKSMHDTAHRLEIQDTVPNFRERERERERERCHSRIMDFQYCQNASHGLWCRGQWIHDHLAQAGVKSLSSSTSNNVTGSGIW